MKERGSQNHELLAPAGSLEKLKVAIHYGADAVYLSGKSYSLRAHATLTDQDLKAALIYAHSHGVKVYVTVNIFAHNKDFNNLAEYISYLRDIQVDGLIISDPGMVSVAQKTVPELPIHLSTQANVTNTESALFWQDQGVNRLNLSRELTLYEISAIRNAIQAEIEVFVHGALCISYSGRCNLSLYFTGRDANRGDCAHPCRYQYRLIEEKRPDLYFPVEEDERGTYIFNSKDLCLVRRLPELVKAGVNAVKIEGRMKSLFYVGAVVRVYRAALDYIAETGSETLPQGYMEELLKVGTRGYTENFIDGPPGSQDMLYDGSHIKKIHAPVGIVRKAGNDPVIEARNPFQIGDTIEYLSPGLSSSTHRIVRIRDQNETVQERANPGDMIHLITEPSLAGWEENALIRKPGDIL